MPEHAIDHRVKLAIPACQCANNCWQKVADLCSCSCTISKCSLLLPNSLRQSRMSACMSCNGGPQSALTPSASESTPTGQGAKDGQCLSCRYI